MGDFDVSRVVSTSSFTYVSLCAIISLNEVSRSWHKKNFPNNKSQTHPQWPITTTLEQSPRPVRSPLELCQSTAQTVATQSPWGHWPYSGAHAPCPHPQPHPWPHSSPGPAAVPSQVLLPHQPCGGWPQIPGGQKWSRASYKPLKCHAGVQTGAFHLPLWSGQGQIKISMTFSY